MFDLVLPRQYQHGRTSVAILMWQCKSNVASVLGVKKHQTDWTFASQWSNCLTFYCIAKPNLRTNWSQFGSIMNQTTMVPKWSVHTPNADFHHFVVLSKQNQHRQYFTTVSSCCFEPTHCRCPGYSPRCRKCPCTICFRTVLRHVMPELPQTVEQVPSRPGMGHETFWHHNPTSCPFFDHLWKIVVLKKQ